ncbi:MAG TPA: NifU family protein [bacterium]|nr:NifU family protein [bacterium]
MQDIKNLSWGEDLEKIIEKEVRPSLQMDGGDIRLVGFNEESGVLQVELQGHCAHCPMMEYTLKEGIEAELKGHFSEIKEVQAI